MARFVIAGKADCPHYAKAELLGDFLQQNLPNFSIHKWPIEADNWNDWLTSICEKYKWTWTKRSSPIIWRELIDRGGRGTLVGGVDDFQEYAQSYYGALLDHFMTNSSGVFRSIANENSQRYTQDLESTKQHIEQSLRPFHICINGAHNPSAYALFPALLSANVFPNRNISLRLTSNDSSRQSYLQALAMEIEDLACDQFYDIQISVNEDAYRHADLIIIMDDYFSEQIQTYFDSLIEQKAKLKQIYDDANLFDDERPVFEPERIKFNWQKAFHYYVHLAQQIDTVIKPTCKILLACSNSIMIATRAFIRTIHHLPSNRIVGLARTIENQAKARIGQKLNVDLSQVHDIHILGDLNGEYLIDTNNCQTSSYDGAIWAPTFLRNSTEMLADNKWLKETLAKAVETRDFQLYTHVEHHHPLVQTQASAIVSFIQDWINGTNDNRSYSCVMAYSGSTLGLDDMEQIDLVCSIPVTMKTAEEIVPIELNLAGNSQNALIRIIKDMQVKYKMD